MPSIEDANHLRILQIHNQYYTGVGGEDTVVALELDMLRKHGHEVEQLIVSTSTLQNAGPLKILGAALSTPWSISGYRKVQEAIAAFRPDLIHVHNTFPLLSPSIYWAAQAMGTPVVQTLHNYRLVCANGLISRDDVPCEKCIDHLPLPALRYGCYKDSLTTAPLVAMQLAHRMLGTLERKVDAYISLTSFARRKMIQAGLPAEKIYVKPNFIPAPPRGQRSPSTRQFAFIGKVIRYKGLDLLLEAFSRLDHAAGEQLVIIGEGPDKPELQEQFPPSDRILWLGWRDRDAALSILQQSKFLVIPSRVVEGLPMVLVEALSLGTPSIAPDHGAFPELVEDGKDGFLFRPRDVDSLAQTLQKARAVEGSIWTEMSSRCIAKYDQNYTEEPNYALLLDIYHAVVRAAAAPVAKGPKPDAEVPQNGNQRRLR